MRAPSRDYLHDQRKGNKHQASHVSGRGREQQSLKCVFTEFHRRQTWRLREDIRQNGRKNKSDAGLRTSQLKKIVQWLTPRKKKLRCEVRIARE